MLVYSVHTSVACLSVQGEESLLCCSSWGFYSIFPVRVLLIYITWWSNMYIWLSKILWRSFENELVKMCGNLVCCSKCSINETYKAEWIHLFSSGATGWLRTEEAAIYEHWHQSSVVCVKVCTDGHISLEKLCLLRITTNKTWALWISKTPYIP